MVNTLQQPESGFRIWSKNVLRNIGWVATQSAAAATMAAGGEHLYLQGHHNAGLYMAALAGVVEAVALNGGVDPDMNFHNPNLYLYQRADTNSETK